MANNKKQTRAMLVEDEANARSALVALLEDEGFAVRAAADGAEALLILKAWHPDVILTDIKMPRVDGLELLTLLETQLAAVPVIVMTAYGSIDDAVDAMRRGAADYITKPIALDRLLPAIQRVLTRAAAQAATGDLIGGRYRLEGKLGEGAMGAVYRTTQLELRRPAAIKMLNRGHDLPKARARLLREAKACAALHHPHAVQIYDVGEDDGRPYLVMELLDGEDLWSRMSAREGPLGVAAALSIGQQIASVLIAAHRVGLVHRDLKPENIFLERFMGAERVRILDFGAALIAEPSAHAPRLTQEGAVIGTPLYIAPEQALCGDVGPPADIYAFGCVLYEIVTGALPFAGSNIEVMAAHIQATPERPSERRVALPHALDRLIMDMLAKAPERRPTAAAVESQLAAIAAGEGLAPAPWDLPAAPRHATARVEGLT
jgi:DNA-binding response OmpR family regulator